MDSVYHFDCITVNGREIVLEEIIKESVRPLSEFEARTFSFIREWFSDQDTFTQTTSGSTGAPKPVHIKRQQMVASAAQTCKALDLKSGDTALVCLDTEFIAGKMMLVRSFIGNMKIVAVNPSPNPFKELSSDIGIDFTALVPYQLYEIIQSPEAQRLNTVKAILIGGAALNSETQKLLSAFSSQFYATYGMTETISHIALQRLNGPLASDLFMVLPDIQIGYDDRDCLVVNAPYLEEKIVTNDLVEIRDGKHFKWIGRADNVINSGGIKIVPEKLEADIQKVFNELNIHNTFIITSLPDSRLSNKIILLIEGQVPDHTVDDIKMSLRQMLRPVENPKEILTDIKFVYTKNGKINRGETTRQVQS